MLDALGRYARQLLLLDAALLFGGVLMTSLNLLLIGWSVFVGGQVLLMLAMLALAAANRQRMDSWSWFALLVLEVGLLLALPELAPIWSSYYSTPTGAVMLLPAQEMPIGLFAQTLTWIGLAFFALAARGAKVLPGGVAWVFVAAAVVGLIADFADVLFITPYWWVVAMLILIFGLVAAAGTVPDNAETVTSKAAA